MEVSALMPPTAPLHRPKGTVSAFSKKQPSSPWKQPSQLLLSPWCDYLWSRYVIYAKLGETSATLLSCEISKSGIYKVNKQTQLGSLFSSPLAAHGWLFHYTVFFPHVCLVGSSGENENTLHWLDVSLPLVSVVMMRPLAGHCVLQNYSLPPSLALGWKVPCKWRTCYAIFRSMSLWVWWNVGSFANVLELYKNQNAHLYLHIVNTWTIA
jgi:hypothetical protein